MLQKMKELGVLFSLCFVCVFSGCEKDTFEETFEKKGNPLTIKKLPFESLKNNPALLHKLEQLNAKKAAFLGKTVTDPVHDFSFDTEDVTYIENGSHHSYTFPIVRTVPGLYVENLVLNREEDGVYHAYITTYKLIREQVLRLGTVGSLNDKMTIRALPDFDMAVLGKGKLKPCHTLITVPVAWNEQGQVTHSELIELIDKDCIDQLNSGGQTSTGDGNSGNGGASDGGWGGWMGTGYDTGVYDPPGTDTGNDTGAEGNVGHVGGGGAVYGDGSPVITTPVVPMTFTSFIKNFKQGVSQLVPDHQWWNTTNGKKIVQYLQHNFNTQTGSVDFQVSEFVTWAVGYFNLHPDVTWAQFVNWFLIPNEGKDGDYDSEFWEDPNLTFQQQQLPSFNAFDNAYPRIEGIQLAQLVGGEVLQLYNQYPAVVRGFCALKVSRALNYSGIIIPNIVTTNNKPGTVLGSDGKYYFLNAKALNKWMRKTFGMAPSNSNHVNFTAAQGGVYGQNFPQLTAGIKGIYSMVTNDPNHVWASGHADLIYNSSCVFGCHFHDVPPAILEYIDIWILD